MTTDWPALAHTALPAMVALRRAVHAEPELGLHNPRTTEKIMDALKGLPLEIRSGPDRKSVV